MRSNRLSHQRESDRNTSKPMMLVVATDKRLSPRLRKSGDSRISAPGVGRKAAIIPAMPSIDAAPAIFNAREALAFSRIDEESSNKAKKAP